MKFKFIFSNKYIYIRIISSELIIVALYIDDILIFTIIEILINIIKNDIKTFFKVKDFDLIDKILDIQIHHITTILTFNQSQYVKKIFHEYKMKQCTLITTLFDKYEMIEITRFDEERTNQLNYQKRIKSFMYLMINIRFNLVFAIDKLNQFCYDSTIRYLNAVNRVFKYIVDITKYDLRFHKKKNFIVYSNSTYDNDKANKKFIYKYILLRD